MIPTAKFQLDFVCQTILPIGFFSLDVNHSSFSKPEILHLNYV